eukprot:8513443-Alexandrium_andersonii.AAC.1
MVVLMALFEGASGFRVQRRDTLQTLAVPGAEIWSELGASFVSHWRSMVRESVHPEDRHRVQ